MAEKRTIELEIQDNSKSLKAQYREAVQELQKVSAQYGETSKEAAKAAKAAAELKDQIEFSKGLVDAFNPDAKFKALEGSIGGVLNGFQAYEGALGVMGVESEKLQETMVRLQSVMALTQGVNGVMEAGDSFRQLGSKASDAFNAMTNAQKAFAVTGIGAVIVGLGLLMSNWDKVTKALSRQTAAQKISNQATKEATLSIAGELSAADKLSKQLKDETLTRAQKIQKVKEFQAAYPGLLKNVNLETMSIAQINKQLEKNIELLKLQAQAKAIQAIREEEYTKILKAQTNSIDENISENNNALTTGVYQFSRAIGEYFGAEEMFSEKSKKMSNENIERIKKDSNERIKAADELDKQLQKDMASLQKQGAQIDENTSGIQDFSQGVAGFTTVTNTNTDALDRQREALQNTADLQKQIIDEQIKQIKDEETKAYEETKLAAQRRIEEIKKTIADEKVKAELIKEIETNLQLDLIKINDEYVDKNRKDYQAYKEFRKKNAEEIAEQEREIERGKAQQTEKDLEDLSKKDQERIKARFAMMDSEQLDEYNRKAQHQQSLRDLEALNAAGAFKTQEEYLIALEVLENKYAEKDIARKNELRQKTLDLTAKSFSALAELAGSFNTKNEKDARKQFQVQKAFNLAAAITNTAMAVTGALTAGGNPIKLATGMQFVEAGIAATVGAANIIKISNSKFGGGCKFRRWR